jgi:hypothetical protein
MRAGCASAAMDREQQRQHETDLYIFSRFPVHLFGKYGCGLGRFALVELVQRV